MIYPTIHTNGTSPEMLRRGYEDARLAVVKAIQALDAIEFNARDYYPQGAGRMAAGGTANEDSLHASVIR